MRFLHTSDLHIGKRLHEQSLINEQKEMLADIIQITQEQSVDAILIAGDVYDRSVPSIEAVDLFDDFITALSNLGISVFIIAGNHDSAERLDFGARIMSKQNVFISGGELRRIELSDEYGKLSVWLMPYMRSQYASETLLAADTDSDARNVLLAHQFALSDGKEPDFGGSEVKIVGGVDAIDASLFDCFDHVALGHIHRPQRIGRDTIRYSGSPYRYSFDECSHTKHVVIVDIKAKGDMAVDFVAVTPKKDLHRIKCNIGELGSQPVPRDAYVEVTLTDDEPIVDAITKVRDVYPNALKLIIDNKYTRQTGPTHTLTGSDIKAKTPLELFEGFFEQMNGVPISESQRKLVMLAMEKTNETN